MKNDVFSHFQAGAAIMEFLAGAASSEHGKQVEVSERVLAANFYWILLREGKKQEAINLATLFGAKPDGRLLGDERTEGGE